MKSKQRPNHPLNQHQKERIFSKNESENQLFSSVSDILKDLNPIQI
jgi:hypothetical protein